MKGIDKDLNKININWYPGHMAKTKRIIKENINFIDVVYEVIDARMPQSSKIKDIDEYIGNLKKILIMTKIDMCDMEETNKWIKYYESLGYVVYPVNLEKTTNLTPLINLTKNITREDNEKRLQKGMLNRKTRVLVVGIPNAGKSTLINRLVGKKVTQTGNMPGVTKQVNWIRINNDLELMDTPGILWPKLDNQTLALNLASLTSIKEEILPIDEVVNYILKTLQTYYPNLLNKRYGINSVDDFEATIETIGKKRGCLVKGGCVDYDKVFSVVMNDIKIGSIGGITFDRFEK